MRYFLCFLFGVGFSVVSGSSKCKEDQLPCENGECINVGSWCDSSKDCSDGTDEKYCKKKGIFSSDPNNCPEAYYKCKNGRCIPMVGKCDGYDSCGDSSDENECRKKESSIEDESDETSKSTKKTATGSTSPTHLNRHVSPKGPNSGIEFHPSDQIDYLSMYSHQRETARKWLVSQRRDFGWAEQTPRALTALYLSDEQGSLSRNESDLLMVKHLEVRLALDMARNETKPMRLTDLALYINALMVSCKDPKNFYGENLVSILRNSVDIAHRENKFVIPSVYLTLCINNATIFDDTRELYEISYSRNVGVRRMGIQALALLSAACIFRSSNFLPATTYEGYKKEFYQRLNNDAFPGNVYEASLLAQALLELKMTRPGLLDFILKQQQEDGSFGGILATYLTLPVLAGRSFLQIKEHCGKQLPTEFTPLEVLKNSKRKKILVRYGLNYGNPPEVAQTIQMQVPEGTNFLDIMRLAEEANPKFRFMLDSRETPVVYSIGGVPNDAEKGMFWTLHFQSNSNRQRNDAGRLAPYTGNIKQLIPRYGDEFAFWMKSM